jgi:hypothetical protein
VAEAFAGLKEPGCGAISVLDSHDSETPIFRGPYQPSLHRLSANSDFSVLVAGGGRGNRSFYQRLRRDPGGDEWRFDRVRTKYNNFAMYSALLVFDSPSSVNATVVRGGSGMADVARFTLPKGENEYIEREDIPFGLDVPDVVPELMLGPDGDVAAAWTRNGWIYEYRTSDMSQTREPVAVPTIVIEDVETRNPALFYMRADLSPGGRYLVMNQAESPALVILDRSTSVLTTVDVSEWITMTGGVAFNAGWENRGLLAVHGAGRIAVFRFDPGGAFELLSTTEVGAPMWNNIWPYGGPLEWSGDGSRLIVGINDGPNDYAVFEVGACGRDLELASQIAVCASSFHNAPTSIVTANGTLPTPSGWTATCPTPVWPDDYTPPPPGSFIPTPTSTPEPFLEYSIIIPFSGRQSTAAATFLSGISRLDTCR